MPCSVLPGNFGKAVQGVLALLTLATLGYKWRTDDSGRNRLQFLMDTFKNCSGAATLHFTNLVFARFLAPVMKGADECHWYFIEIMVDTTLGVYVEFFLLMRIIDSLKAFGCTDAASDLSLHATAHAQPGEPSEVENAGCAQISWCKYIKQVIVWLFIVTLMKAVMVSIMVIEAPQLMVAANFVLKPADKNSNVELVLVMVLTPALMNSLQFWLQDNIFVDAARTTAEERKTQDLLQQQEAFNSATEETIKTQYESHQALQMQHDEIRSAFESLEKQKAELERENEALKDSLRKKPTRASTSYWHKIVFPIHSQLAGRKTYSEMISVDSRRDVFG